MGDAPDRPTPAAAPPIADEHEGDLIIRASWGGTALYSAVALISLVAVKAMQLPLIVVTLLLFVAGLLAFMAAYGIAVSRSREVDIGMGGLFFLAGTAPPRVRRHLMGSFAVEVIVAVITGSLGVVLVAEDASNPLAFGFLVPLYGLGIAGLWGARYGAFASRSAGRRGATD